MIGLLEMTYCGRLLESELCHTCNSKLEVEFSRSFPVADFGTVYIRCINLRCRKQVSGMYSGGEALESFKDTLAKFPDDGYGEYYEWTEEVYRGDE